MIHIMDDWYVDTDDLQYISGVLYKYPNGTERLIKRNYHSTLAAACQRVQSDRKRLKLSKGTMELKKAVNQLQIIDGEFNAILERVMSETDESR